MYMSQKDSRMILTRRDRPGAAGPIPLPPPTCERRAIHDGSHSHLHARDAASGGSPERHQDARLIEYAPRTYDERSTTGGIASDQGWAASKLAAARNTVASPRRLPTIWRPTGKPLLVKPHGIEIAGNPSTDTM